MKNEDFYNYFNRLNIIQTYTYAHGLYRVNMYSKYN